MAGAVICPRVPRHPSQWLALAAGLAILALIGAVFLLPYLWTVASGLKDQSAIFRDLSPISWRTFWPREPTLQNVQHLFVERGIGRALFNSALVSLAQVVGTLILSTMAAYALTRIPIRGKRLVYFVLLLTFLVPYEALIVPLYALMGDLGLQDSLAAVFLPWIASPLGVFLLRPAFEELPRELDEAARLDGAGHLRVLWSIVLPNVTAALVTLALITFLFSWNAFLWPLVVLQSPEKAVIQIAIAQSLAPGQLPNWGETFAGAAIATLPLLVLFLWLQRYFVKGLGRSGMK